MTFAVYLGRKATKNKNKLSSSLPFDVGNFFSILAMPLIIVLDGKDIQMKTAYFI